MGVHKEKFEKWIEKKFKKLKIKKFKKSKNKQKNWKM